MDRKHRARSTRGEAERRQLQPDIYIVAEAAAGEGWLKAFQVLMKARAGAANRRKKGETSE